MSMWMARNKGESSNERTKLCHIDTTPMLDAVNKLERPSK